MKKLLLLIPILFISIVIISQPSHNIIKVSPDLELIKLSENSYVHVSFSSLPGFGRFSSNGLILVDGNLALLFDTPSTDSLTLQLVSFLRNKMGLEITGFVPNHWHEDCMGGLKYLQSQNINSYANQITINIAREKGLPVPEHQFTDSLILKVGDKPIFCYYLGAAHSLDNIVVWIPSEKILFPGCMCKSINSPDLGNVADGDLSEYAGTIERVIAKFGSAEVVIPGHGPIGGLDLLLHTRDLAKTAVSSTVKQYKR